MCMLHLLSFPIRILLEYVTYIHMCTKRYPDIWNFVCTQETQRTHQTKSLFSDSLQRQRDARYGHCEGHNGWWLACRMNVYAGGSDQMLYQHITVLTPGITASCSSVQPSFLVFIVEKELAPWIFVRWHAGSPSLPPGKSEDFCNMKSARFQNLGTNKKVIIVHPQTRYWSPVERTLKLFLTFFPKEKIQTQETGRPFVPVLFLVFLRGFFGSIVPRKLVWWRT